MDEEEREVDRRVNEYMQQGYKRRDAETKVSEDLENEVQD